MSKKKLQTYPHTAIPSWSGFVYQGKAALYHAIKLLTDDSQAGSYHLQLDSLDDFAILDKQRKPISIHQVKAYKSTYYSGYEAAFNDLCKRSASSSCTNAFFHTARKIADKTVAQIEAAHSPLKIYLYDGNPNCALNKIDNATEEQIKKYFQKHDTSKLDDVYIQNTRECLNELIQRKVINIHSLIHQGLASDRKLAATETIPLSDIRKLLEDDIRILLNTTAYFLHLTRQDLNSYYQAFCTENEDSINEFCRKKLNSLSLFINQLNETEIVSFIKKIMPQRAFDISSIKGYKDLNIRDDEVKDAFIKCLHELKEISPLLLNSFQWKLPPDAYVPTTIIDAPGRSKQVCGAILKNILNTDIELPFETTGLITAFIDVFSVYEEAKDIMDIEDEDDEAIRKKQEDHIMRWKQIELISLEKAKNILS